MERYERRFPCIADMRAHAARRIPGFAWDYLVGGIGTETCLRRNAGDLDDVRLMPHYARADADHPEIATRLLGREYAAPFGVAPMGLQGLIWPGGEKAIAAAARAGGIVHVLSTHSNLDLAESKAISGEAGWFQLYPINRPDIEDDLIGRADAAGYDVMVVTVDIPGAVRRDRDIRSGLSVPPKLGARTVVDALSRPHWLARLARHGIPRFRNLERYGPPRASIDETAAFLNSILSGHVTLERFRRIRAGWKGRLVVKGLLDPEEAAAYVGEGADAVVVSNHGGRQLDAAPSAAAVLPAFRERLGPDVPILADGGVRNGLDIARLIALGADHVLLGRPFVFAATLGDDGPAHLVDVLKQELRATLQQLGCADVAGLPATLHSA
jgi:L-lactate dehydrogenase (cytochrome)